MTGAAGDGAGAGIATGALTTVTGVGGTLTRADGAMGASAATGATGSGATGGAATAAATAG